MWTTADIPAQHRRVALVTGANAGLGFEVTRQLALSGATVVMAARDEAKADRARRVIVAEAPDAAIELAELDLASMDAARECAERVAADHARLDLLVNNAGVMGIPERPTADGLETQLAVNHLGHFVLTARLLPALLAAPHARVVSVTSFARFVGRTVSPANPHLRGHYDPWRAYSQSKLANLLFAVELQRRLEAAHAAVASLAAHPGLSHTGLQAHSVTASGGGLSQRFWHAAARTMGMPPHEGALPLLRAATDPAARGGELYGPRWVTFGPPVRRPAIGRPGRAGATLWDVSEQETGERVDVAAIVAGAV